MADPLKALGELHRIRSGSDPVLVKSGNEAVVKVEQAIELLKEHTSTVQGAVSASEGRMQAAIVGLGDALNGAVKALYGAVDRSSSVYLENIPKIDLQPVLDAVESIPPTDTAPIIEAVEGVARAIDQIPVVDLTDLMLGQRLLSQYVQEIELPETDLQGVMAEIAGLKAEIEVLKQPKTFEFDIQRVNSMPQSPIKKVTARQV